MDQGNQEMLMEPVPPQHSGMHSLGEALSACLRRCGIFIRFSTINRNLIVDGFHFCSLERVETSSH